MAQVVSRRPLTAESRFAPGSINVEFMAGKVSLVKVFLRVLRFYPVSIIPPSLSNSYIIRGMNNMSVSGSSSETYSHFINNKKAYVETSTTHFKQAEWMDREIKHMFM
jgi:hypothetical protein